ncbi:helix-turn-helix transcriptional regulator [Viridibacillus arvi]|uniref:helix-turn-helix domain-containing protein n=1 Tax=Viridibacillus arvi TaxID=263475 RepID=UPI003D2E10DB
MRNNFRVILAKRKLKMSDVVRETRLSKNTIRALYYESAKGVQFQTLEAICDYLQCDVGDIFQLEEVTL